MKIFQPITSYLLAALVAVVHLGVPARANAIASNQQPLGASQQTITWKQQAILHDVGQRSYQDVLKTGNKLSGAEHLLCFSQRMHFPLAGVQKELIYFQSSRFVITGLEVSTIIFPFHFFW